MVNVQHSGNGPSARSSPGSRVVTALDERIRAVASEVVEERIAEVASGPGKLADRIRDDKDVREAVTEAVKPLRTDDVVGAFLELLRDDSKVRESVRSITADDELEVDSRELEDKITSDRDVRDALKSLIREVLLEELQAAPDRQ